MTTVCSYCAILIYDHFEAWIQQGLPGQYCSPACIERCWMDDHSPGRTEYYAWLHRIRTALQVADLEFGTA